MTLGRDQIRQGHDDYHQCDDNQGRSRMLANGEAHTSVQSRLIVYASEKGICRTDHREPDNQSNQQNRKSYRPKVHFVPHSKNAAIDAKNQPAAVRRML
jgi:hypothetical protein